jgi:L-amino acid N-acyltransferase YncA
MQIREATLADAAAILEIYAPAVNGSIISFETSVPALAEYQARMTKIQKRYPWLVAEHEGVVIGYAYASTFRERAAYQWAAESSVYVRKEYQGKLVAGISPAKILYEKLFTELSVLGFKQVLGVISLPNPASVRFHEKMGFTMVGTFPSVGYKNEEWIDVLFLTKFLEPLPLTAPPIINDRR